MKIAPYLATSVQRSYLRQQRIGERIAELKGADESAATQPAAQVDIPEALLATSRTGRKDLKRAREEQIDQLTGRFVERFLETFGRPAGEGPQAAAEGGEEAPGRPSFGRILRAILDRPVRRCLFPCHRVPRAGGQSLDAPPAPGQGR